MAIEYGSSPAAQGMLRAASGGRAGSASQPDRAKLGQDLERPVVAEEPALGDDHLLDQRLDLVGPARAGPARTRPSSAGPGRPSGRGPPGRSGPRRPTRGRGRSARPAAARPAPTASRSCRPLAVGRPTAATASPSRIFARLDELEQARRRSRRPARGRGAADLQAGDRPPRLVDAPDVADPLGDQAETRARPAVGPAVDQDDPRVEPVPAGRSPIRSPRSTTGTAPPRYRKQPGQITRGVRHARRPTRGRPRPPA